MILAGVFMRVNTGGLAKIIFRRLTCMCEINVKFTWN